MMRLRGALFLLLLLAQAPVAQAAAHHYTVSKSFSSDPIPSGGTSVLTITLGVGIGAPNGGANFTDNYPTGITNAANPGPNTTCTGGTVTAAAGGSSVALAGGTVPANGTCTVTVTVTSSTVGTHTNTIPVNAVKDQFGGGGNLAAASDTLTVTAPANEFTVVKSRTVISDPVNGTNFPKSIPGAVVEYSMTLSNSGSSEATSVVLTDVIPANTTYLMGSIVVNGVAEDDDTNPSDETNPDGADFGVTAANTVTARIANIAIGASATVVFRVTVN